jgi:hypothetical protein
MDIAMERAYNSDKRPSSNSYPSKSSGSDPMVLGALQGPPAGSAGSKPKNFQKRSSDHKKGPLSQEEKDRRRKLGLCAYCGSADHAIHACPLARHKPALGNGQQRPRGA